MTISLLAVAILPLLLFGIIFSSILNGHLSEDLSSLSRSALHAASSEVSSRCTEGARRVLPTVILLSAGERDPGKLGAILEAFATPRPEYAALLILDAAGRIEARYPETAGQPGATYRLHEEPVHGDVSFSSPFPSSEGGRPVIEAVYTGAERSVVSLMDLGWFSSKLLMIADFPDDRLGVVDADGRYLMCSDPSRVFGGEAIPGEVLKGGLVTLSEAGRGYYVSSVAVPGSGWSAVYYRDRAHSEAPLRSFIFRLGILLGFAILFALLLAILARRSIASPLSLLMSRIGTMAEGNYGERISGRFAPEFQEIGEAFNTMAASIERRDRELLEDVAERKLANEKAEAALAEKTLLLREVYHRVKNNLQIISSLLNMQAESSQDPAVIAALRAGQDRVITMSLAHELVYQMEDLSSINLEDYATRLLAYLADAYGIGRERLGLSLAALSLDLERALPVGLVLTELVSNACKYGCKGRAECALRVALAPVDGRPGMAELIVEDEGPGLPAGFEAVEGRSLGVSIVLALARQLHGSVSWGSPDSGRGTRVSFRFPLAVSGAGA
jgi:two-component sensor histidine kinase/HAMP domain-containing protein